jgi:hypothetical protein
MRFTNKTLDYQLWYCRALLEFFGTRRPGPLVEDLRRAVAELEELGAAHPPRSRPSHRPPAHTDSG